MIIECSHVRMNIGLHLKSEVLCLNRLDTQHTTLVDESIRNKRRNEGLFNPKIQLQESTSIKFTSKDPTDELSIPDEDLNIRDQQCLIFPKKTHFPSTKSIQDLYKAFLPPKSHILQRIKPRLHYILPKMSEDESCPTPEPVNIFDPQNRFGENWAAQDASPTAKFTDGSWSDRKVEDLPLEEVSKFEDEVDFFKDPREYIEFKYMRNMSITVVEDIDFTEKDGKKSIKKLKKLKYRPNLGSLDKVSNNNLHSISKSTNIFKEQDDSELPNKEDFNSNSGKAIMYSIYKRQLQQCRNRQNLKKSGTNMSISSLKKPPSDFCSPVLTSKKSVRFAEKKIILLYPSESKI